MDFIECEKKNKTIWLGGGIITHPIQFLYRPKGKIKMKKNSNNNDSKSTDSCEKILYPNQCLPFRSLFKLLLTPTL